MTCNTERSLTLILRAVRRARSSLKKHAGTSVDLIYADANFYVYVCQALPIHVICANSYSESGWKFVRVMKSFSIYVHLLRKLPGSSLLLITSFYFV